MDKLKSIPIVIQGLLVFILSIGVIWFQAQDYKPQLRTGDSYIYLSTAKDLLDEGVLTNGTFGETFPERGPHGEGTFFTPAYPAFLAAIMAFDKSFYNDSTCHLASKKAKEAEKCGNNYKSVIILQIILCALSAFIIWLGALLLTKNLALSWLSLIIGLASGIYGEQAASIMTEALLFPLFSLASLLAALGWKSRLNFKQSNLLWLASGLVFGFVALTRPAYAIMIYSALPFLYAACLLMNKQGFIRSLSYPLLLLVGFILAAGPWMLRNQIATGDFTLSKGYSHYILVQRLAYNDMTPEEWRASFIYHLPDFGDSLVKKFFDKPAYERFNYGNEAGFFYVGHTKYREEVEKAAGGSDNALSYALHEILIPNLPKHLMVTIAMIFNGIWIGKYWGLIVIPLVLTAFGFALRRPWSEFIVLSFPGWFMLGFHAFTSVNVTRYNMPLVPSLSLGAAWMLILFFCWIKTRLNKKT